MVYTNDAAGAPGAAWQRADVAGAFLDERRRLLPLIDVQEDLIRGLLAARERPIARFLDVGAGDGAFSELVLDAHPGAEAVLADFSEPMLERAGERLARFPGRWRLARCDLSDSAWPGRLPAGRYDAAVSAFAIHHFPPELKRRLFAELLELLEPGGVFVNMDRTLIDGPLAGTFDEQTLANLVQAERDRGGGRSAEQVERDLAAHDDGDEDRPDTAEDQVRWLADAGFERAEIHFKWAEAAVFGAVKPEGGDS
jgi:tRNA (cmo5U34)-methyltransferase